jgi:hypothetical protein
MTEAVNFIMTSFRNLFNVDQFPTVHMYTSETFPHLKVNKVTHSHMTLSVTVMAYK